MTVSNINIDGSIKKISKHTTRRGHDFIRIRVLSKNLEVDVDVFPRDLRSTLYKAMPGDRLIAKGPGFNRGSIRGGSTSITAKSLKWLPDTSGRQKLKPSEQLPLFT